MVNLAGQDPAVVNQMAEDRWQQAQEAFQPTGGQEAAGSGIVAWARWASVWLREVTPERSDRYRRTDLGAGRLFADAAKGVAQYVPERRAWFVYNGAVWKQDTDGLITAELCKHFADALLMYIPALPDGEIKDTYLKHVLKWQNKNYRRTIIGDATSVYPIYAEEFDADPWLFNCANGTLDLRTGELRKHNPEDRLTKISPVKYDPGARSELWERVIRDVMQDDADKATFLQKAFGYGLTGDTSEECLFVFYGPSTRNGKGTVTESYKHVLGDYGRAAKPDTLALHKRPNGSGPSEDIARLAGARVINLSEPDKSMVLNSALVKTLTGNDTVTARFLNENSFEFRPTFKIFINTNHRPIINDPTVFSSGRVMVIPFNRHFTEAEQDKNLKNKLFNEKNQSAILNWCIQGLRLWQEQGLKPPDAVREATEDYRIESDKIARFVNDRMMPDPQGEIPILEAYRQYQTWCALNGCYAENQGNFKQGLERCAQVRRKRPNGSDRNANKQFLILGRRWA